MKYFKGYKCKTVIAVLTKLMEAIFELMLPLLMARLIDEGMRLGNMGVVYKMVFYMFLLTLLGYGFSLVCQYLASHVSQQVGGRIREALFKKINTFSVENYDLYSSATLTNRMTTDINLIQDMIARTIRLGVRAPFLMIGSIMALMTINAHLAQTLMWSFPLFLVVVLGFMFLSQRYHQKASIALDGIVSKVGETLSGMRIIRAFSKQAERIQIFRKQNHVLMRRQRRVGLVTTLSNPVTTLIMNAVLIILLFQGAHQINTGTMSQGQIIAVINYCTQLVLTLIVAMNLVMIFSRGYVSAKRIRAVMQTPVPLKDTGMLTVPERFTLVLKDVGYRYPDETRLVVEGVNVSLQPGDVVGIIGLTGSGKSTLLKLLVRLMDSSCGSILIDDRPIQDYKLESVRKRIAYVSQSAQFLKGSLHDNITMGGAWRSDVALKHAQGRDIAVKGMDHIIEAGGQNLSGGQRQRVNIARNLAKNPSLILFDDSFSALDNLTSKALRTTLKEMYQEVTQIIVSQRPEGVKDADLILIMDQGKIVASGTHATLLVQSPIYQAMHALQAERGDVACLNVENIK